MGRARDNSSKSKRASSVRKPPASSGSVERSAPGWHLAAVAVALVLAALLAYWPVLDADFVRFDDTDYVTENHVVQRGLTADGLRWAWTTFRSANWHPLTWLSHMLDVELHGLDAGGHHLTNLLLHASAALVLLLLCLRMTGSLWGSALAAGFFALHPAHVESVAWISERKDVLSALFWMLTLWAYARYAERPASGRMALVVLIFALGLLAKPMLVTLPFVLLLLDAWPLKRLRWGALSGSVSPGRLIAEKLPLFALAGASCAMTLRAQGSGGAVASFEAVSLGERLANTVVSYVRYVGKLLWPSELSVYYPHPGMPPLWAVVGAVVALMAISWWAWRALDTRPALAVGWLWFLGTLVPVIGLVQVGGQAIADRYTYIPSVGLGWMLVFGLLVPWVEIASPGRRRAVFASAALCLLALTIGARIQAAYWQDSVTLFERSLAVTEGNYLLHNNLGATYLERGRLSQAEENLREAVRIAPAYAEAKSNLGLTLVRRGDLETAIGLYREAIALDDRLPSAYNNLAAALAQSGRPDEAISRLRRSLDLDPDQPEPRVNLGNALAETGRPEEALEHFRAVLALDPSYANAHAGLGNALVALGRLNEAEGELRKALRLDPDHAEARVSLATVLADGGRLDEALDQLRRAVRSAPNLPQARFFLALGALQAGDQQTAQEQYEALRQLEPVMADQLLREIQGP